MKRILLTGDDGYQSIGTRLVIRALQGKYDLMVAATKSQMSGVGGHVSLKTGFNWGEDIVDGVKAIWVDGYPADAMEFVAGNFPPCDYIISGMNLGANIGPGFPSGTVSAAVHGLALNNAKKAIILSWHVSPDYYHQIHDGKESLDSYIQYPLQPLSNLLKKILSNDLWGADIVNVNFPEQSTHSARSTKSVGNLQTFYNYPVVKREPSGHYIYSVGVVPSSPKHEKDEEVGALMDNIISITPWKKNMFHEEVFTEVHGKDFQV